MKFLAYPLLSLFLAGAALAQPVLINEIMYHPASELPSEEWIELANVSAAPVDLSGWRFVNGVDFTFPAGTVLGAGRQLVAAANRTAFVNRYPSVTNVIGDWAGQLSNSGEQIELANAAGEIVDTVRYADAGDWGTRQRGPLSSGTRGWDWTALHDGGGSSLELINPGVRNDAGQNWASSTIFNGTPGAANSAFNTNTAPLVLDAAHTPAVPSSSNTVAITARIVTRGTNNLAMAVRHRLGTNAFTLAPMSDDGMHGDGALNDGVWGAILPAQTNGAVVEFYIQAAEGAFSRTWPAAALDEFLQLTQTANAQYQVDDSVYAGPQPILRLVMTEVERARLTGINRQSDAQMNVTLVSIDGTATEIRYLNGIRIRGAGSRNAPIPNYRVNIPSDWPWNGLTAINLNSQYPHAQIVGSVIAQKSGLPAANARIVQVRVNGVNLARSGPPIPGNGSGFSSYALLEPVNNELAGNHFPLDPDGNVYRASSGPHLADLSYRGTNPNDYISRGYSKTSNGSENDWTDLIDLTFKLNFTPDEDYSAVIHERLNLEEWMIYFAVFSLMESSETSLGTGEGDDYALYRGFVDPRFQIIGHDFDTIFGQGDSAGNVNESIFVAADPGDQPAVDRFLRWRDFVPVYLATLQRLGNTVFSPAQLHPIFDQHLTGLVPDLTISAMKDFSAARVVAALNQIPMQMTVTNALPLFAGYPRTTEPFANLAGLANAITTRTILVNGFTADWIAWRGAWSLFGLPLQPGINRILVQSLDGAGREVERATTEVWYDVGGVVTVSGTLGASAVWSPELGPYYVNSTLTVPSGITLTIQPGTTVYFAGGASLVITGTGVLAAEGADTQRIRFTKLPGAPGNWGNVYFNGTTVESRLVHVDLEFSGGSGQSVRANNAVVRLEHLGFTNVTAQHLTLDNSSFAVRHCVFPTLTARELIHGSRLPASGYGIIQSNWFGTTTGVNDIVDFTGGQRPAAILQILDNLFSAASDDHLDLDGTDAHIEGNVFLNARQETPGGDTASAVSGGSDSGNVSELTIVRNLFFACDHAALIKEGNFYTFENNTIVRMSVSAVNFNEPLRGLVPGAGARLDGNLIWDTPLLFENFTNETMVLTVTRSLLPSAWPGAGNVVSDPLFVETNLNLITAANIREALRLRPGSPALGAGPNGLDIGALVPAGASISGEPPAFTPLIDATLTVGGPGVTHYRSRVNNGPYGPETAVTTPVTLTGLADGSYTVSVLGKNSAGVWQDTAQPTVSKTWTVDSFSPRLQLSEVLARNVATLAVGEDFPDLVELHNPGAAAANLGGMGLTDDPALPYKFTFPPGTMLGAGVYLVLYADTLTNAPGLHLGFALSQAGDALFLYDAAAAGGTLRESVVFGPQLADLSLGRQPDGSWTLSTPTFGAANQPLRLGDATRLKINEWLANGRSLFPDDFIEVFNPEALPVNLGEFFVTDFPQGHPAKHRLPPFTFVAAGGFLLLTADGDPTLGGDHVDFRLSPDVGAIGLFDSNTNLVDCIYYGAMATDQSQGRRPNGGTLIGTFIPGSGNEPTPGASNPGLGGTSTTSNILVNLFPLAQVWRYEQSGMDLGTAWRAPGFIDSSWSTGPAILGFDNDLPNSVFGTLLTIANNKITFYFRTTFNLPANLVGTDLSATINLDDGAVFYVNGLEAGRTRMPGGNIDFTIRANTTVDNFGAETIVLPGTNLVAGQNTLAVEVHQSSSTSGDVAWGMLLNSLRVITNSVPLPAVINEVMANNLNVTNAGSTNVTDWVEIYNPSSSNTVLSGMSLSDSLSTPRRWVFPAGVTLAPGAYLIVQFNGGAPASTNAGGVLNTGFGLGAGGDEVYLFDTPGRGGSSLDSVAFGLQAPDFSIGRTPNGSGAFALNVPTPEGLNLAAALGDPRNLRFNEWLANPVSGDDDFFELFNPNPQPVALGGLFLTDNLLQRTKYRVPALSFISVGEFGFVEFIADGNTGNGADHPNFSLSASGESLGLFFASGETIDSLTFMAQQNGVSEGRFPDGSASIVRFPGTLSPGRANILELTSVLINEALTHTDPPLEDAIELYNPTFGAIDLSGWFLSDRMNDPKRFRIPDGTVIQPGGYVVFYESQFNPPVLNGRPPAFSLSSFEGDEVFLSTADAAGNLTGFRAAVKFGAAANGVSFGRHATSVGYDFTALSARTFGVDSPATVEQFRLGRGAANAAPLVGPVVISEIHYHPPDQGTNDNVDDEFIELQNISGMTVPLFDPAFPTNTWRLRDAVDFDFPIGVSLPAGGLLLVVSFDPATNTAALDAFRTRFGLDGSVAIYGPFAGRLANSSENLELYFPGTPQGPMQSDAGETPFIEVDKVRYADIAPWPSAADGSGASLQRRVAGNYGNDPVNWFAATPMPGVTTGSAAAAPTITALTGAQELPAGASVTLSVTATGAAPLRYQWRLNGNVLPNATNTTLNLTNLQAAGAGDYSVLVNNTNGAAAGTVRVSVNLPPIITRQPQNRTVGQGQEAAFTVVVNGTGPLAYQWRKNGQAIAGATNGSFVIPAAVLADEASYSVFVTNRFGTATSAGASLLVIFSPEITLQPEGTNVFTGTPVTFSAAAVGSLPLSYQWLFNGQPLAGATNATFTLASAQVTNSGTYRVSVTNRFGSALSSLAGLTVLAPPVVTVRAGDATASEAGANTGTFVISRTGTTNVTTTVHFVSGGTATAGSDYAALSSPAVFNPGITNRTITVTPIDDNELEFSETVVVSLAAGFGYVVGSPSSATVNLINDDNVPPSVTLTNPIEGALFISPTNVPLGAAASDVFGFVTKVEFFDRGTNKIGEVTAPPYVLTWSNVPPGSHILRAVATDDFNSRGTSAPVTIFLNTSPAVALTSPTNGQSFTGPTNLLLTATASDSDGGLDRVEFYQGATLLGADATAPYGLTWSNVAPGSYGVSARAVDTRGAITISSLALITVQPTNPPFSDLFAGRGTVTGYSNLLTGSNAAFTKETGEPQHASRPGSRSAWVSWMAPASGTCTMNTLGSSFDTVLAVYSGDTVSGLTALTSNDDVNLSVVQSQVSFSAVSGRTYHIAVDGYATNVGGNIILRVSLPSQLPVLTSQPQSQVVNEGATVSFTATASSPFPPIFQWRFHGTNLPGATFSTLTLSNVTATREGPYALQVINARGSALSVPALLTVRTPPRLAPPPVTQVVEAGANAAFGVGVNGTVPVSYQWFLDGAAIAGATNSSYTRANAQHADTGSFRVSVGNLAGSVMSPAAELHVRPRFLGARTGTNGQFHLNLLATPGRRYAIEAAGEFTTNGVAWSPVMTIQPAGVQGQINVTNGVSGAAQFYRLRLEP